MPKIGESVPCNTAPFRIFLVNVELCLDQRDCRRGITAVGAFCNPSGWRSIPNGLLLQFAARHKHCRTTTALAWEFSCNQKEWAWNKVWNWYQNILTCFQTLKLLVSIIPDSDVSHVLQNELSRVDWSCKTLANCLCGSWIGFHGHDLVNSWRKTSCCV